MRISSIPNFSQERKAGGATAKLHRGVDRNGLAAAPAAPAPEAARPATAARRRRRPAPWGSPAASPSSWAPGRRRARCCCCWPGGCAAGEVCFAMLRGPCDVLCRCSVVSERGVRRPVEGPCCSVMALSSGTPQGRNPPRGWGPLQLTNPPNIGPLPQGCYLVFLWFLLLFCVR